MYTIHPVGEGHGKNLTENGALPSIVLVNYLVNDLQLPWELLIIKGTDAGRMASPPERLNWLPAVEMPADW